MNRYHTRGPVPLESPAYVARKFEDVVVENIFANRWVLLLGPRQHGKTTGLIRVKQKIENAGLYCARIDLQAQPLCNTYEEFVEWFARTVGKNFGVTTVERPGGYLDRNIASWLEVVIPNGNEPVVVIVDEAAAIENQEWLNRFYGQLRSIVNNRDEGQAGDLVNRLQMIFSGTFQPEKLISNSQNSPFNVCERVETDDLTRGSLRTLRYQVEGFFDDTFTEQIYEYVGGQPYLVQVLLSSLQDVNMEDRQRVFDATIRDFLAGQDGHFTNMFAKIAASPQLSRIVASLCSQQVTQSARSILTSKVEKKAALSTEKVDFLLVSALAEEQDALLNKLPGYRKLPPIKDDIRTYFRAELPVTRDNVEIGKYLVIVMPLLGMGRVHAATATGNAITRWHPRYIMLVGIAGGVARQGINIGDILIADQIVDYELQKVTPHKHQIRWDVHRPDPRLLDAYRNFKDESWRELQQVKRPDRRKPKHHIGPIASGDKVIAFSEILEELLDAWPRLIGVEMEAAGVATAAFQSSEPPGFFMVRCVSDLANEHKSSAAVEKWRSYACDTAASFAIALLKSGPVPLQDETTIGVEPEVLGRSPTQLPQGYMDIEPANPDFRFLQVLGLVRIIDSKLVFRNRIYREIASRIPEFRR